MKTVLVIDDNFELLGLIERFLRADGFRVVTRETHGKALDQIAADPDFDLAIVDFWLDGRPATEILDGLLKYRPNTPVIMISGGGGDLSIETTQAIAQISGSVSFLQKPFSRDDLLREVRAVLR